MGPLRKNPWIRRLALLAAGYALLLAALMIFENKLIFFPIRYPAGDWNPKSIAFEDAWFEAADGTRIHGWFVPRREAKAAVLVAHGNGGNLAGRADLLEELHRVGAATLIFDYRGYGRSAGSPSGDGIVADARAARAWLARRLGIREDAIVLFGESLGGAVAVRLAAEGGARALIVQGGFSSIADVAAHHYPWAPVRFLLRTKLDSAAAIRDYRGPFLQCHGDRDVVVPYEIGRRLFDAANDPKEFVTLSGADHNQLSPTMIAAVERLLNRL